MTGTISTVRRMGALLALGFVSGCAVDVTTDDQTNETLAQEARGPSFQVLGPDGKIRGKTYEQWSTEWWQWAHGIPNNAHPAIDDTGEFCDTDQNRAVFFLAGTFGGAATRNCTIPHGKPVFFPLINLAGDNCGVPPADQLPNEDIIAFLEGFADFVTDIDLSVDGTTIGSQKSDFDDFLIDVTQFSYFVPDENSLYDFPFGLEFQGTCDPSWSSGYYAMIQLAKGSHTLHFSAAQVNGFALDVTYNLTAK